MKKTDIAMIIMIASISALAAYFIASRIPALKPDPEGVSVSTAKPISSELKAPNEKIFNSEAINPTVKVTVGSEGGGEQPPADEAQTEE